MLGHPARAEQKHPLPPVKLLETFHREGRPTLPVAARDSSRIGTAFFLSEVSEAVHTVFILCSYSVHTDDPGQRCHGPDRIRTCW